MGTLKSIFKHPPPVFKHFLSADPPKILFDEED